MDVRIHENDSVVAEHQAAPVDIRQRRALARLGLGARPAYVAPTLLALRSVAAADGDAATVAA